MALGAGPARIASLLSCEVLLLTGSGVAVGLCAYAAAAVWIRRVLYDVRSWEPMVVVAVVVLVGLVAAMAAAPATWRAVRIDPARALRAE
jgi:ABC-type antimicrobial peptide transport system permease subunit